MAMTTEDPKTGYLGVRVPHRHVDFLRELARRRGWTLSVAVRHVLEEAMARPRRRGRGVAA